VLLALTSGLSPATWTIPDKEKEKKKAWANQFLLFGTVFTEQGFALPGCEIRVRRAGERKVRWEARSDRPRRICGARAGRDGIQNDGDSKGLPAADGPRGRANGHP